MEVFWEHILGPLLRMLRPQVIVEIGAQTGITTEQLIGFAYETDAVVHAIDPLPSFDVDAWTTRHAPHFVFHRGLSLDVLDQIDDMDLVLVDGDHNWYTVHTELQRIEALATSRHQIPPTIALHDVSWPYGRRDAYYDLDAVPVEERQPTVVGGVRRGWSPVIKGGGMNSHLPHADHEGGRRNGVLTAVEDYLIATKVPYSFTLIPSYFGLALLVPEERSVQCPEVSAFLEPWKSPHVRAWLEVLEEQRLP